MEIKKLNKKVLDDRLEEFLEFESNWTSSGETLWMEENFKRELPGKFELSSYITLNDELAGYAIGSREGRVAKLNKIVTSSKHRGKGLGTKLWSSFVEKSKENNLDRLEFKVLSDNKPAINIYDKSGCIYDGITEGSDGKSRKNVIHILKASKNIPHSNPNISEESISDLKNSLNEGNLASGPNTEKLISLFKKDTQKKFGVGTNSGSNALYISLKALGLKEKDEVILPSYVCGSVLHAVENSNAKPVLADIERNNPNMSLDDIVEKITRNTKAIIVPHMFGETARYISELKKYSVPIIEDVAQAINAEFNGLKAGSFGDIAIYSFYPTKILTSFSGGLALTNNKEVYEKMNSLLEVDNRKEWDEAYSMNMRDADARLAVSEYKYLEDKLEERNSIADIYNSNLPEEFERPSQKQGDVYFRYVTRHEDAEKIIENLNKRNIDARKPVYKPLHQYKNMPDESFPNTSLYHEKSISLPIYPGLEDEQVREVIGSLHNWRNFS